MLMRVHLRTTPKQYISNTMKFYLRMSMADNQMSVLDESHDWNVVITTYEPETGGIGSHRSSESQEQEEEDDVEEIDEYTPRMYVDLSLEEEGDRDERMAYMLGLSAVFWRRLW